jgi:DNA-binding NtrC family response regulator
MKAQSKYYKISLSGNIRQLRNVAEQISVLETNRDIMQPFTIHLPSEGSNLIL